MPSIDDVFNKLQDINSGITQLHGDLGQLKGSVDAVKASVNTVDGDTQKVQQILLWGFAQMITLEQYNNAALFQNDQQNDTMICILEHISKNTCALLNEAHQQTELQQFIKRSAHKLADLYATTHADAELARAREELLRDQIEKCCPPKPPAPVCGYSPCPAPEPFRNPPPQVQPPPDPQPQPPR